MSVSINIHRIKSAEAYEHKDGSRSHSYVTMKDQDDNDIVIHIPEGALHKDRADYLAEAIRLAFKVEFAIAEGFLK